jgi:hypothetical protein
LYLVTTSSLSFSINSLNIETALCKYHHQLSLKSIISHSVFIYCFKALSKSHDVSSQKILIAIYAVFQSSNILESTDGIFIFSLITSKFNILFSHFLITSNFTFVQAGHLILSTASYNSSHSSFTSLALVMISHVTNQYFFAGDHFINLSIITHISLVSTTAQIHSKSHDNTSLNFFVSSIEKYSLCLSHNHETSHLIALSTSFVLSIQLAS